MHKMDHSAGLEVDKDLVAQSNKNLGSQDKM